MYKNVINFINKITKTYKYKPLPEDKSKLAREFYLSNIPDFLNIEGSNDNLYSTEGTLICRGYNRIVIGDYGAFIEYSREQAVRENCKCAKGQEYRYKNQSYKSRVKYFWYTTTDTSNCKIYFQQKTVSYADYKPMFFYISPYEVQIGL